MAPWRLFNIGGQHPVELKTYLALLEKHLGQKAIVELLPLQPGDVLNTCAEASDLAQATGFQPRIELYRLVPRLLPHCLSPTRRSRLNSCGGLHDWT
ncbi:hypothetical protein D3C81_1632320 [compost metagenome]